jgi:hypothetical protein
VARSVYITIDDLRRVIPDTTAFPDDVLWELIEIASDLVECLTDQLFGPTRLAVLVNGWGRRAAAHPKSWKIIQVDEVRCLDTDQAITPFPYQIVEPALYAIHDRCVRYRPTDKRTDGFERALYAYPDRRWPYDDKNVEIHAVWGDIDKDVVFETELAEALKKGDTTVKLLDTSDLNKNDALTIDGFWLIVKSITVHSDPDNNIVGEVSIDPSCFRADAGTPVYRYGAVHRLIRQAVLRTAVARRFVPGSEDEADIEARNRIRREETDNYEIEFFAPTTAKGAGGAGFWSGTGDPVADSILSKFRAGPVLGRWV